MVHNSKFVFFGSPEFAATVLEKLIEAGFMPAAVVCNPDRPIGRKKIITPPPVKQSVKRQEFRNKITILQPEELDEDVKRQLLSVKPEFGIVAAYAKIISKEIIEIFPRGLIGVHPSLLPKYRGATPIQSAILEGEDKTGITIYLLDEKVDHGPILAQRELAISPPPADNFVILIRELAKLGGKLLVETLPNFLAGEITSKPQSEPYASYTKKFTTEDAFVDPRDLEEATSGRDPKKAVAIDRKIRALNPEPGTWTIQNGKRVKLLEATLKNGKLVLKKIQTEGKKPRTLSSRDGF